MSVHTLHFLSDSESALNSRLNPHLSMQSIEADYTCNPPLKSDNLYQLSNAEFEWIPHQSDALFSPTSTALKCGFPGGNRSHTDLDAESDADFVSKSHV